MVEIFLQIQAESQTVRGVEIVDRVRKRSVSATHHFGTNSFTFLQYSNKGAVPTSTILLRVVFNTKASPDISQSYFTNVE
jgi:hypothetical protein